MRWQRAATYFIPTFIVICLAGWQYREFVRDADAARETLHRSSHAVMNALVGGIQSHRRRGRYFAEQLHGSLEGLVRAKDILAVGLAARGETEWLERAGDAAMLPSPAQLVVGDHWQHNGLILVQSFPLPESVWGGGEGPGGGFGRGYLADDMPSTDELAVFGRGGEFLTAIVLDRSAVDQRQRAAAWLRGTLVLVGGLCVFGGTVAWHMTVASVGRARQLDAESRHLRELGQAAAGLAHETKNPLGLIRGWAQRLVQSDFPSDEQRQQAIAIVDECDRVTARINEFLSFARPHSPELRRVALWEIVQELKLLLELDLEERDLEIRVADSVENIVVLADRELLRQALFNILQNAIHASPAAGVIEVSVRSARDGRYRIEIADRGAPLPPNVVQRLFTPYFTTRTGGTGLGLAIVRHVASLHGWVAGYSVRPGGGAIFWLDGLHG